MRSANDRPVAADNCVTTAEGETLSEAAPGVLANDSDADGDATASLVDGPSHGTLSVEADGSFTYEPNAGYHGADAFTYVARDAEQASAAATVAITVTSVNDSPVARDDAATVEEDGSVVVDVLSNDSDADGDELTVSELGAPAHGSAEVTSTGVRYVPATDFHGTDRFTYTVTDGNGKSATAEVVIEVRPINDRPVAGDDSISVIEGQTLSAVPPGVLTNDSDTDGDALTASLLDGPGHGTLSLEADGSFTYQPAAGYHGSDAFTYVARDGDVASAPATVAITVTSVNEPPVARDDAVTVAEDASVVVDVLANDSDADGDTFGVSGVGGPSHGSAEAVAGGVRYTPAPNFNGSDSLVYTVSDGNGGTTTATLRVTVTAMPEAPSVALSRTQVSVDYGDPIPTVTATATDGDTPGKSLRFTASGLPAGITLVDNRNGTAKISGKANVPAGTYAATIRASDGARTGSSELVLTVRKESASLAWDGDHFEHVGRQRERDSSLDSGSGRRRVERRPAECACSVPPLPRDGDRRHSGSPRLVGDARFRWDGLGDTLPRRRHVARGQPGRTGKQLLHGGRCEACCRDGR